VIKSYPKLTNTLRSRSIQGHWAGATAAELSSDSFWLLLDFEIHEIAIHGKFTDQGIDLAQNTCGCGRRST
jgi:hypothetical protein